MIEDLGDELVVKDDPPAPIESRYEMATDLLAELHQETSCKRCCRSSPASTTGYPATTWMHFLIEVELLLDWYLPKLESQNFRRQARHLPRRSGVTRCCPMTSGEQTWVLRDFHSPNLLWLPEREGTARVGLLDFQDAVMGPAAYDVASLLQDARVDVPEMMEIGLLSRYTRARRSADAAFDAPAFARAYATLAAQRASKILGIFARLERRDHKPQYLRHLPRVWAYLQRSLAHPALAPLAAWYRVNVPPLKV